MCLSLRTCSVQQKFFQCNIEHVQHYTFKPPKFLWWDTVLMWGRICMHRSAAWSLCTLYCCPLLPFYWATQEEKFGTQRAFSFLANDYSSWIIHTWQNMESHRLTFLVWPFRWWLLTTLVKFLKRILDSHSIYRHIS